MNQRARLLLIAIGGVLLTAALAWFLFVGVERWRQRPTPAPAEETAGRSARGDREPRRRRRRTSRRVSSTSRTTACA